VQRSTEITPKSFDRAYAEVRNQRFVLVFVVVRVLEVQRSTAPVLVRVFRFAGLFTVSPTIQDR